MTGAVAQAHLGEQVAGAGLDLVKDLLLILLEIGTLLGQKLAGDRYVKEQVEIDIKYAGYIKKQKIQVARLRRQEAKKIPKDIDYDQIEGLATEAREKFAKIRPETLAQAERISGVNPADLAILSVYVQNGKYAKVQK